MKPENITSAVSKTMATMASLLKVVLLSKGVSVSMKKENGKEIIIMGNGPSLRQTIDRDLDWLITHDLMAVNFAAITPDFFKLRPKYYILADNHFFNSLQSDPNVSKMWKAFQSVSWEMTLLVPVKFKHLVAPLTINCPELKLRYFNLTPIEGYSVVTHGLFSAGLGMPRPRNVLIPAIMEAIRMGYEKIFICGADHSWTKTLDVDDDNFVVSVQPHFYKDNEDEHKRVRETYQGLKLHDVLGSMVVAFKSYWQIADYARKKGVTVLNATPGSMIDAFPKIKKID